jgi:AcrR family transcriptional regulator
MPRQYNPKETVERVLAASVKLFMEKGFDKTSMQDIVDDSKMSKGAILYHFKCKEAILEAVMGEISDKQYRQVQDMLAQMKDRTAREKIETVLKLNMEDTELYAIDGLLSNMEDPNIIVAAMQSNVKKSAVMMAEVFREGISDGSITTEYPEECAEVLVLLLNTWIEQIFFPCDLEQLEKRLNFLKTFTEQFGIPVLTTEWVSTQLERSKKLRGELN